jgi:hypothetical protein
MVHLLLVTKVFDQTALFNNSYIPNHTAVKTIATNARRMTNQSLGNFTWVSLLEPVCAACGGPLEFGVFSDKIVLLRT